MQEDIIYRRSRFKPPEEPVMNRLIDSQKECSDLRKRSVRCPVCGYRILEIYEDMPCTGHIRIKCRKCKFEGALNLRYFVDP